MEFLSEAEIDQLYTVPTSSVTSNSILASKDWNDPVPAVVWDYPPQGVACGSFAVQQQQAPFLCLLA
jgi:hypothetical protein